jgi:hypothetical protein
LEECIAVSRFPLDEISSGTVALTFCAQFCRQQMGFSKVSTNNGRSTALYELAIYIFPLSCIPHGSDAVCETLVAFSTTLFLLRPDNFLYSKLFYFIFSNSL